MCHISTHYQACRQKAAGFTLAELLITIIVLSIAALVVLPGLRGTADARVLAAARLLVADLDQARMESLSSAADRCVVEFDTQQPGYWLARQSDPLTPIPDPATGDAYRRVFGVGAVADFAGMSIDVAGLDANNRLVFTGQGRVDQAANGLITLSYGPSSARVVIDAATGDSRIAP